MPVSAFISPAKLERAPAGASLEHSHSQLIVTSVVPISVTEEIHGSLEFYNYRGRCIYCDMIQQELAAETRIVLDTPRFVVFCPFAARCPFETWIVPKQHSSHYENIPRQGVEEMGTVLGTILSKIEAALDDPPYNFVLHTAPFDAIELPHYHWHLEIFPRLTRVAGFEWGSGFYINPVPPEEASGGSVYRFYFFPDDGLYCCRTGVLGRPLPSLYRVAGEADLVCDPRDDPSSWSH